MLLAAPLHLLIILVAAGGFLIASHIRRKKLKNEALVCPLNSNCEAVIHSQYSRFLGLPLELLGMIYYAFTAFNHLLFLILPAFNSGEIVAVVMAMSVMAALFSFYLTYIQAAKLREWCTWCLISALFCSIIFLASLALL